MKRSALPVVCGLVGPPTIHYDLACCAAVLGNLELPRINLAEAIRLEPKFRDSARMDTDLAPLHGEIL